MKMRVADYLTDALYNAGGENVFLVTGGMIMHLTDALLQHKSQKYTCVHHEQSAVMAADAYGRYTGKLGVAYVTAGPAALNTLTGVVGALVDSSPCIIVSGQSKVSQTTYTDVRQFALQGFNTLPIFSQVTKYAVMLTDVKMVKYEIEKCIYMAKSGRVGPVWIECPIDIQGAYFDPDEQEGFPVPVEENNSSIMDSLSNALIQDIIQSKRPCILAGAGVRLSQSIHELHQLAEHFQIPLLTSRLGMDIVDHNHPLFAGRPGTYGDRAANFTIQNSDLLIVIGCRLAIGLVGYDYENFAHNAKKIMIDIDSREMEKPSIIPDVKIHADAKKFLQVLLKKIGKEKYSRHNWVEQTQKWKQQFPVNLPMYSKETNGINSYHFMNRFSEMLPANANVLVDTGSCFHVHAQAFKVKAGQRHIITGGLSTMGFSPASIGMVAAANNPVYCITGDGSFQFNIQEMQTIKHYEYKIKTILFNNNCYGLIKRTQENFLDGRFIGIDEKSGVSFPDMEAISKAYGIDYIRIASMEELDEKLELLVQLEHAVFCEVIVPSDQLLQPRVASKKLEDGSMVSMAYDNMFPFLPEEEYHQNQLVD
jgi:acetolactate synthase I/II/III large subunit